MDGVTTWAKMLEDAMCDVSGSEFVNGVPTILWSASKPDLEYRTAVDISIVFVWELVT